MLAAVFLTLLGLLAAANLAFRTDRGGWLGMPLAAVTFMLWWLTWIDMPSSMEIVSLCLCASIAALCAFGLPKLDQLVAALLGSIVTFLMLWVVPSGDSPLNIMVAGCAAGFAGGALIGILVMAFGLGGTAVTTD